MLNLNIIRYYFKIAWRHLMIDRLFTFLNLFGLSTGLTCTILISLWIIDELRFDKFHEKDSQLYEVMIHQKTGNSITTSDKTGDKISEIFLEEIPEIEMVVTTTPSFWFQKFSLTTDNTTISAKGNFVSADYFNMFSYPLIQGNKSQVLTNKNSIAISEKLAIQLFSSSDLAMGQTIEWKWQAFSEKCIVSGVFKDFPRNSSQQYEFLVSIDAWYQIVPKSDTPSSSGPFDNFVVIKEGENLDLLNKKIANLTFTSFKDSTSQLFLFNHSDKYLYSKYENGNQAGGRIEYIRLFVIITLIILLVACINFINLSTARANVRAREVGVKKYLGASRLTLIFQFLGESLITCFIAMLMAILMTWILLPQFNNITQKSVTLHFDLKIILTILTISIITGILAGSYPAFHLSRFNPAAILKGNLLKSFGELVIRRGLVVFQFTISVIFIISVLVVYQQINYVQYKNLGYDKDNILYFEMDGRVAEQADLFLSQLKALPGVVNASSIQQKIILPTLMPGTGTGVRWEGKNTEDQVRFHRMPVNYDLIETLGIKMEQGRSFSRSYGSESANIIINRAAVEAMDIHNPIGKTVMIGGNERSIIGVSQDFHFNSLHEKIYPFILYLSPQETMSIMVRIETGKEKETISRIHDFYKEFNPGYSFDYKFLDDDYQAQYTSEKLISEVVKYFAVLTIIISYLGLFGLVAFTAERRKKEITIRKVLGATVGNIVSLLTKDFLILVLIAICIAFPFAWWLMNEWLQNFAYHVSINLSVFGIASLLIISLTLITIGYHSIKSALLNPSDSLKSN